ncbi:MAG: Crp/Fnr family transcriptional regulator [Flavobacteriaceae bacterium]|nr:Crp/Fnr family transcriptional regulator [Flavobacteriaceae bacterium]
MNKLVEYFEKSISLTDEVKNRISEITIEKELEKGDIILYDDSFKKQNIFVVSGCLRSYFKSEDGKEHTIQFAINNWWISDYTTLYTENKSVLCVESLTKSKILVFNKDEMMQIIEQYSVFKSFIFNKFSKRITSLEKRVLSLLTLSATERYKEFIKDYSVFEQIIPNYQIASYLGVTPQSLSRIRKDIAKK